MQRKCVICGANMPTSPPRGYVRVTCSPACRAALIAQKQLARGRKLQEKACDFCGKVFKPPTGRTRFCSMSCSSKARGQGPITRICVVCGNPFETFRGHLRATCSDECKDKRKRMGNPGYDQSGGKATVLDKYGKAHKPHVLSTSEFPLPVDPQFQPFSWEDTAHAA